MAFCTPKPFIEFKYIKKFQSQFGNKFGTEQDTVTLQKGEKVSSPFKYL